MTVKEIAITKGNWREIGASKRRKRDALIPAQWILSKEYVKQHLTRLDVLDTVKECGILTVQEVDIVYAAPKQILENLQTRRWSAIAVTTAYCKSSAVAQQMTNCLTEIMYDEALKTAESLDRFYNEHRHPKGPLHGLPISIKDNFNVAGYASSVGFTAWAHEIMTKDSELIAMLREMGAVLYVKTNVPVAMMMAESENHIYGATTNPFNRLLSAGGSSGGEAALIAMKGSCIGVGTDIGGSIRIPASFNNLFSLRPSFGRFPTYGARSGMPGQEAIDSVNGPMSNTICGLEIFCKSIVGGEPWNRDPRMLPIPWRQVSLPSKLSFGVIWHNTMARPHPPIERGLRLTVSALRAAGHEVIEWDPKHHPSLTHTLERMFLADGGHHIGETISQTDEPYFPFMYPYRDAAIDLPTSEMWKLHTQRNQLCRDHLQHWLDSRERTGTGRPVDAVISPVSVFAGSEIGRFKHVAYTGVWNVLDYSAGTVPVTRASRDVDVARPGPYEPLTALDVELNDLYDANVYHGGAVSIQLIARRLEEEKLLEMMKVVHSCTEEVASQ